MTTPNKITKTEYPDVFGDLFEFAIGETYDEPRRRTNRYRRTLFKFDADNLPEHPVLHGFWETDTYIHENDEGPVDPIDEIFRVEEKKRVIEQKYYERVKGDQDNG